METSNLENPIGVPENNNFVLTSLEIVLNRIFAIFLVLTTVPFLKNILAIPTIILFMMFSIFLFFRRKYRLFANIIFFIFALGVYFVTLPVGWGLYHSLKEIRLGDFNFYTLAAIFSIAPLIFVTLAVRNVLGNILAYFKIGPAWRNVSFIISLVIILLTLLAYPFFDSVRVRARAMEDDSGDNKLSFILTKQELKHDGGSTSYSRDYTARFDPINNKYVYRLYLEDPLAESIAFVAVKTDGEKINFATDSRVTCLNCQKDVGDPYSLVFPAGKDIDFIITSDRLIKNINFTEPSDKVADFFFWK